MNWQKEIPEESGWFYVRSDRTQAGWSIRWVDATDKTVWFGQDAYTYEDYKDFNEEWGDKIPDPQ